MNVSPTSSSKYLHSDKIIEDQLKSFTDILIKEYGYSDFIQSSMFFEEKIRPQSHQKIQEKIREKIKNSTINLFLAFVNRIFSEGKNHDHFHSSQSCANLAFEIKKAFEINYDEEGRFEELLLDNLDLDKDFKDMFLGDSKLSLYIGGQYVCPSYY